MKMAGIDAMREYVSRQYGGGWADKVRKMSDRQVMAICHRMKAESKEIRRKKKNPKLAATEVRGGVQLSLFKNKKSLKIKEEYLP